MKIKSITTKSCLLETTIEESDIVKDLNPKQRNDIFNQEGIRSYTVIGSYNISVDLNEDASPAKRGLGVRSVCNLIRWTVERVRNDKKNELNRIIDMIDDLPEYITEDDDDKSN